MIPIKWAEQVESRMDAADKRMQFIQDTVDTTRHWLDAAKERIAKLENQQARLAQDTAVTLGDIQRRLHDLETPALHDRLLGLSLQLDNLTKRLDAVEAFRNMTEDVR